jgi:HD-GYP domain-containing protein (c-di-GMP phosphodiesterase class II)
VTTAAAQSVAAPGELTDEIVRAARERYAHGRSARRTDLVLSLWGLASLVVLGACALLAHGGTSFSPLWAVLFVVLYAAASHVEFEVGTGVAVPIELVLVPMLFALPLWFVPLGVALAFVLRTLVIRPFPLRTPARVLRHAPWTLHAAGPVVVLSALGGVPLRWHAWPVYVLALVAQFGFDFANTVVHGRATGVPIGSLARFAAVAYAVDAALAPVGLLVASTGKPELILMVVPLAALLRYFATERRGRIDNALELSDAYRGTAFLLGDVVEADDAYTGSHSRHVVDLVLHVADALRLSPAERRDAEFVALLHDVGKIRIPSEIINKPGPLDADERALMETHTIIGEELLEQVGGLIGHIGRLVRSCHERWDGTGYPDGLAGEEIPLIARIVCACDAYSAMTTDRSYRKARTREDALAELERSAGSHFDPRVVDAIVRVEKT